MCPEVVAAVVFFSLLFKSQTKYAAVGNIFSQPVTPDALGNKDIKRNQRPSFPPLLHLALRTP